INALAAATAVLIPVSCEYMSLRGLELLLDTARRVQKMINPRLDVLGVLPTRYAGQTVNSREVVEFLRQFCQRAGLRLFEPPIRQSVRVQEAPRAGMPLVVSDPTHEAALAYRALATEINSYVEQKAPASGANRSRQAAQRR
ncbi:MAG: ParA family protein, partial [Firmicutes bacterium]|nr:ParA family protein [Bacillota bacterium]